jgi:hypothetical protein
VLLEDGVEEPRVQISEEELRDVLTVDLAVKDRKIAGDLFEDLTTRNLDDPREVLKLLDRSVSWYAYWCTLANEAESQHAEAKIRYDIWYADQAAAAKSEIADGRPPSYNVTDAAIRNWVCRNRTHAYQDWNEDLIRMDAAYKQCRALKDAWDKRITALQSISKAQIALWERSR